MTEMTVILNRIQQGDAHATDELRRIAVGKISREPAGQPLQPTALVHEAWLRLAGEDGLRFQKRAHFFAADAEAMRRSLVDRARRRLAAKRGGGAELLDVDALGIPFPDDYNKDHVRMNDALERLAAMDPRKAELV